MEDIVAREVATLKQMMRNWRKGFLSWVEPGVEHDYILQEFRDDISQQLFPYVTKLLQEQHLSLEEATELMDHCYAEVRNLEKDIEELKNGGL